MTDIHGSTRRSDLLRLMKEGVLTELNVTELIEAVPSTTESEASFQKWAEEVGVEAEETGWADIEMEGVKSGYQISELGEVIRPNGELLKAGFNGRHLNVQLRRENNTYQAVRLAKLMLWVFVGGDGEPFYIDGDEANCRLDNLRWSTAEEIAAAKTAAAKAGLVTKKQKPAPSTPAKKKSAPAPTGGSEVEVFRVYKYKGLTVEVDAKGRTKLPKVNMTPDNMLALAKISERINEMNRLMKLGE